MLISENQEKSKWSYYQHKLKLFEGDIENIWKIIKNLLKKRGVHVTLFPKKFITDNLEITDTKTAAKIFNNFFVTISPNLASKFPKSDTNVKAYISKANTKLHKNRLTEGKILEAFKTLKINKAPGFDEIHANVINQMYNRIRKLLIRIFGDSIKFGVFLKKWN